MSKTTTTARIRPDGKVVEVLEDGSERPFPKTSMRPMTEEEIHAAAMADPDARPMTPEQRAKARRVPRVRTLRRALGLTQLAQFRGDFYDFEDFGEGQHESDQGVSGRGARI